jgi:hypothetical protein
MMTVVFLPLISIATDATASWAEPAPAAVNSSEQDTSNLEPHTPAADLEPLSITEADALEPSSEQSRRLDSQAQQINRDLDARQPNSSLEDLLDLPEGMVIRGSSRGGIGIGAEY